MRCTGGLIRNTVKDLSLRGCAQDSVRGQGGCLWMFAIVRDFGPVSSLQFGFVLERQQVGLLLLQALVQSLSLALLLQLPPLELLLQSAGSIRDDEKRMCPYKFSTYLKPFPPVDSERICDYICLISYSSKCLYIELCKTQITPFSPKLFKQHTLQP